MESNKAHNLIPETPAKPDVPFNAPFMIKEGVILVSVRFISVASTLAFIVVLTAMGLKACNDGLVICEGDRWPMISAVICLPIYSRVAALLFTFVMLTSN